MPEYFDNYNKQDVDLIKKQLGNKNKDVSICGIWKRCRFGFPQIIFLNPIRKNKKEKFINYEAISNITWLTCPYLNEKIHELEDLLYIKKIKALIEDNNNFKNMMQRAHADYYFTRNIIYNRYVDADLDQAQRFNLTETGIGGIGDLNTIKCLHIHYCHYNMCRSNIAGFITYLLLGKKTDCDDAYCMCYK